MNDNSIQIWRFEDAPEALRKLSTNGGDEDWLAVIPPNLKEEWIPWMDSGTSFGCYMVFEYEHPIKVGYVVRIGCHA